MKLIPDARLAWRFDTVQAALLLGLLSAMQADLLPILKPLIPPDVWPLVSAFFALAIILLRVRAQPALEAEREQLALDALDSAAGKPQGRA
jgi:hypothetical protein